jgi:uncharacterized protein (UPF0332 family)
VDSICRQSFQCGRAWGKAALFCLDFQEIVKSKGHGIVRSKFNLQRKIGNVDAAHSTALNRLWDMRQTGRYLEAEITFSDEDADSLLADVRGLIEKAHSRAQR